ncbi:MAG: hypothetical protein SFY68_14880 [Candidatus Sumerlaeia bacterium]|nr:hypothetical protein [Candidatus Sumerlaeia bacterium]
MSRSPQPYRPQPTPVDSSVDNVSESGNRTQVIGGRGPKPLGNSLEQSDTGIPLEVEQRLRAQLESFRHDLRETPDRIGYSSPRFKSRNPLTVDRLIHDVLLGAVLVGGTVWLVWFLMGGW